MESSSSLDLSSRAFHTRTMAGQSDIPVILHTEHCSTQPRNTSQSVDLEQPSGDSSSMLKQTGADDLLWETSQTSSSTLGSRISSLERSSTHASLVRMTNRWKRVAKATNYILKSLLVIPIAILGFPWLYVAAFVVERKEQVDYSWAEVRWRIFGGLSFTINAALMLVCIFTEGVLTEKQYKNLQQYGMGTFVFICAYSVSMSLLCIIQALWGRYHEEKERGGGVVAVKYFWRKILMIVGIDLKQDDHTVDSSWVWSFSVISCVIGALVFTIYDLVDEGLNQLPVTGKCVPMAESASIGSACGDGMVYAVEKEGPCCCTVTIRPHQPVDYMEEAGAIFFFLFAILKVFASIFVWAENTEINESW